MQGKRPQAARSKLPRAVGWVAGFVIRLAVIAVVVGGAWTAYLDIGVRSQFEGKRWQVPARIYARPLEVFEGLSITPEEFEAELSAAGYTVTDTVERPGTYARSGAVFDVVGRPFRFWDGTEPARRMRVAFENGRLQQLTEDGTPLAITRIDPPVIGRVYPSHREDRVLVRLEDMPPLLVESLLAVEDRNFYRHFGLSFRGIARAMWANLRAGATVQGGSTLTQQLAKNFFLTPERSLWRKFNEALIALILEARYSKVEILEAYLNEIYLGQEGSRAVHGVGLAAEFYFGRPVEELHLQEVALLVGLARGASAFNPRRHPERAAARRDIVLDTLAEVGVISLMQAQTAKTQPLGVLPQAPSGDSLYPGFMDLVRRQLQRDYREEDLRSDGLRVFSTLSPRAQAAAERAISSRLAALEAADARHQGLDGAVVLSDPRNGEVLALVGGVDVRMPGFNRALDALRPIGSMAKPPVYLTALEEPDRYNLATPLQDLPIEIQAQPGTIWAPENYDKKSHGIVPLYVALANSYNQATVRLGMEVGVARVARTFERLGIERRLQAYPSLLLGAVELTPIEIAQMYQTIAADGFFSPLRAIRSVTDGDGEPLARYGLSVRQAVEPGPVFLLKRAMTETMRSGTGQSAYRRLPSSILLAGKTGTTDDLRDSWFAGFGSNLLGVVWVGRDDNTPSRLTGASGALQIWTDMMVELRPAGLDENAPEGVAIAWVDPHTGTLTDADCPDARALPFIEKRLPIRTGCMNVDEALPPVTLPSSLPLPLPLPETSASPVPFSTSTKPDR